MRCFLPILIVVAIACGRDDGPVPIDGGSYVLTSSSEGPPPVLVHKVTDPNDGSTVTDYTVAQRITFERGTARAVRDFTSNHITTIPGTRPDTFSGTGQTHGSWVQSGNTITIGWEYDFGQWPSTVVDTLQLVNGQLHAHWSRQGCAECGAQGVDVTYVRDRKR